MKRLCLLALLISLAGASARAGDLIGFWDTPRYGGNSFNQTPPDEAYFRALKATGATWTRLTFSKWKGEGRDFLIGDADAYVGIPTQDLAVLIRTLDAAEAAGIKVVIVPLSLPGARWAQHTSNGKPDLRHWNDARWWRQSARFWTDLAAALKDHPAVAGYNLINEPVPEMGTGLDEHADAAEHRAWYVTHKGGPHDLVAFYETVITAVRAVDPATPIMVDGGWYGGAMGFVHWPRPLTDQRILYSFHMYEPYEATSGPNIKRSPQYRYPGQRLAYGAKTVMWDKAMLEAHLNNAFDWAGSHGIPANRVVAGEFGCVRQWTDCAAYLADVTEILDRRDIHWAFYSFREDVWDAMDYEIPPSFRSGQFYFLSEQGKSSRIPRDGPLMSIIKARMR